jgi:glycosyltransferase involved in cell wall biosynthesis
MSSPEPSIAPFFATAAAPPEASRLLLLSYHFPPSEEVGALRWQKLTGALAAHGWATDVVTLHPSLLDDRDDRRLQDLPAGTRVFGVTPRRLLLERCERLVVRGLRRWRDRKAPSGRPVPPASGRAETGSVGWAEARGPLHSLADLRRGYHTLAWLARDRAWARAATRAAARVAAGVRYHAVITSGPPHLIHLAAVPLARRIDAPLVLDLRDPWSFVERLPERYGSALYWRIAARCEARAVRAAALVVTVTEPCRAALVRRYPEAAGRTVAVLNGFDPEPPSRPVDDGPFTIAYAGTIYLDRDPRPLLRAAASVVRTESLTPERFRLVFLGQAAGYGGVMIEELAAQAGLAAHVDVLGRLPRREALAVLARAHQLVVLPQDSHLAVPAKLYEYMTFPSWILAIADPGSAVAETLAGTAADVVAAGDSEPMAEAIRRCIERRRRCGRPTPIAASVPHLSRERQAAALADALAGLS